MYKVYKDLPYKSQDQTYWQRVTEELGNISTSSYHLVIIFFQLDAKGGPVVHSIPKFCPTGKRSNSTHTIFIITFRLPLFLYYYLRDLEEKRTHFAAIVAVMHELALVSMTLSHNGKFLIPNLKLFEYKVFHFLIIIRRTPAFTYHDLHIGGLRLRPGCSTNFLTGCDQGSECIVCLQNDLLALFIQSTD